MSTNNKTIRIKADTNNPNEKYLNVKLEQDFELLNVLSLTIKQSDVYRTFNADYGVVCGRVQTSGVGLPNCRVSIFIPISDNDSVTTEMLAIYPFKKTTDTDVNGKKYNLLSRLRRLNPFSGFKENNYGFGYFPKTPVGSIPDKNELLVNDSWVEVYKNYYKFTTTTNTSGDYMFIGVPVGTYTLHVDADITDVGKYSTPVPVLQKILNLPKNLFNEETTKLNYNNDLTQLPNIYTQDISINVIPFWGDKSINGLEIGITRQDVDLKAKIYPSSTIFGSAMTSSEDGYFGNRVIFNMLMGLSNLCITIGNCEIFDDNPADPNNVNNNNSAWRIGAKFTIPIIDVPIPLGSKIKENVDNAIGFCIRIVIKNIIPFFIIDAFSYYTCQINGGNFNTNPFDFKWFGKTGKCCFDLGLTNCASSADSITDLMNINTFRTGKINTRVVYYPEDVVFSSTDFDNVTGQDTSLSVQLKVLNPSKYVTINESNGNFIHIIPANRRRVITNEIGEEIEIIDKNKGVFTEFSGAMIFDMNDPNLSISNSGSKISTNRVTIKVPQCQKYYITNTIESDINFNWIADYYTFKINEVYSISQYMFANQNGVSNYYNMTGLYFLNLRDDKFEDGNKIKLNYFNPLRRINVNGYVIDNPYDNSFKVNDLTLSFDTIFNTNISAVQKASAGGIIGGNINNEWSNGMLYFLQYGVRVNKSKPSTQYCDLIIENPLNCYDNNNDIGGGITNSKGLLRADLFPTNFVHIKDKNLLIDLYSNDVDKLNKGVFVTDNNLMGINNKIWLKGLFDDSNNINILKNKDIV
jgi:hypothetical protein